MSAVRFCVYCISAMSRPCLRSTLSAPRASSCTYSSKTTASRLRMRVVARQPLAPEHGARPADGEVAEQPEALDGLAHRPRHVDELAPRPLHARERDERAQDLVRPLEDEVDPRVAQQPLVRVVGHVADAGGDLERLVDDPPARLAAVHLADGALDAEVVDARRRPSRSSGTSCTRGPRCRPSSSAILSLMSPNSPMGRPNARRSLHRSTAILMTRLHMPEAPRSPGPGARC